jgi:hypothetical protein
LLVPLTLLSKFKKINFNRFHIILFLSVGFILSTNLIVILINILPIDEAFKIHLENYTTGHFALEEYKLKSFLFKVSRFLSYFVVYPAIIFVFCRKREISHYTMFILMTILLALTYSMNTVYSRYAFISVFLFIIPFFIYYNKLYKNMFLLVFVCSFVTYVASIQTVKRELKYGMQNKILYTPFPLIFSFKYSNDWIQENINNSGDMIKKNN